MSLFKKNKNKTDTTPKSPTYHEMGLHGTVDDFYAAVKAAKEDLAAKKSAYKKSKKTYDNWNAGYKKHYVNQEAYWAAKNVPYQIQREFLQGACAAFQDDRPENIQHILSVPGEFLSFEYDTGADVAERTFMPLLVDSANPDTVPDKALARVAKDERQGILDYALCNVAQGWYGDVEKLVSALLKADAKASNKILALALHKDVSDEVAGLLIKYGANLDEALETMRNDRNYYGGTPEKIEALQCKDARIRELEETIAELTGTPKKTDAAPPTRRFLKTSPAGPQ